jgi:hypothetical protein
LRWGGDAESVARTSMAVAGSLPAPRMRLAASRRIVCLYRGLSAHLSTQSVPDAFSRDVYLVLDNFGGRLRRSWRETDESTPTALR